MKAQLNQMAIENFLGSLDKSLDPHIHYANARLDAKSYKWDMKTLNAILKGIARAYAKK